jgi:hypothetical protein
MNCYPCLQTGVTREAAGLCHHCSAALCADHIYEVEDPITLTHIMSPSVILPKKARLLLCPTCKAALEQPSLGRPEVANSVRAELPRRVA